MRATLTKHQHSKLFLLNHVCETRMQLKVANTIQTKKLRLKKARSKKAMIKKNMNENQK